MKREMEVYEAGILQAALSAFDALLILNLYPLELYHNDLYYQFPQILK